MAVQRYTFKIINKGISETLSVVMQAPKPESYNGKKSAVHKDMPDANENDSFDVREYVVDKIIPHIGYERDIKYVVR